jgi:hypothetical protein
MLLKKKAKKSKDFVGSESDNVSEWNDMFEKMLLPVRK